MPKNSKKLIAVILSAVIAILSAACTSPTDTPDISNSLSVSTESAFETAEETVLSVSASDDTETTTDFSSNTTDYISETEESASASKTASEALTEAKTESETETDTSFSDTEAPETAAPTTPSVTEIPSETETSAPAASVSVKTETSVSSTSAEILTKTETTPQPVTAATSAETTVSSTTAETTANTAETGNNRPTSVLSNPNTSSEAQRLYLYLTDTYGKGIISGQQESTWMGSEQYEFDYIFDKTGKYPAIRGLDYMNDDFYGVNRRAAEWYDRGGIVTICWHCGCDFGGSWSECMNTELKDWDKALTEGTEEYKMLVAGMDKAANALKELKDKNIPVLWRPFHELDGGWFWWSKGGAENFKKLWIIMYDRYTNYWGLDNLIWVCGFSGNGVNYDKWYPGDAYVDIAGADSYNDGANARLYKLVGDIVGDKMPICFHECGRIPTVEQLRTGKADWVWFMTWHTDFITSGNDVNDLQAIYNDPYVITLDELPDWQ